MPLVWDEVNESLDARTFTIANAIPRMEKMGTDPVAPVLESKPDLAQVLEQLAGLMAG